MDQNCKNCKHVSINKVPETVDVLIDEHTISSDEEVDLYICRHPNVGSKEIGREPIKCDNYEVGIKSDMSEADRMIAKFEARQKG